MKKQSWKSKKWIVVLISELKYNPYKDVDEKKKRPVLIWNNSLNLNRNIICFYCTSKNNANKPFLIDLKKTSKKGVNTFVDLSHSIFVKSYDINWNENLGSVKDDDSKKKIKFFLNKYYCSPQ